MKRKEFNDSVREKLYKEEGNIQTLGGMVDLLDHQLKKEKPSLSKANRQDIVQDTLYNLYRVGKVGKPLPYIFAALRNQKVTHFRKQKCLDRWANDPNDAYSFEQTHFQPTLPPDAHVQADEYTALLARYIRFLDGSLSPALRAFFRSALANVRSLFGGLLVGLEGTHTNTLGAAAFYQSRSRLRGRLPTLQRRFLIREGLCEDPHAAYILSCFNDLLLRQ